MSGVDIEGVLVRHGVAGWRETRVENELAGIAALYRPECSCGELLDARDRVGSWTAHVAAVLREQIAAARAEAWAEGCATGWDAGIDTQRNGGIVRSELTNPYRAAQVAPSRVPGEET